MAAITREHRMAFVIMIDLSGSMNDNCNVDDSILSKGDYVIDNVNSILQELYMRAVRDGEMVDYFDVAVVAYYGNRVEVISSLDGSESFTPITKLYRNRRDHFRVERVDIYNSEKSDDSIYKSGVVACEVGGLTPMLKAADCVHEMLQRWCGEKGNRDSVPPIIVNITDGMFNDSDTQSIVNRMTALTELRTNIGNSLLINIFVATGKHSESIIFPTDDELSRVKNNYFALMGKLSSVMPEIFRGVIEKLRLELYEKQSRGEVDSFEMDSIYGGEYRAIGFDIEISDLISVLRIGTDTYYVN